MPTIDTSHPLSRFAKVYDGDGKLVRWAVAVDTDAGKCRRMATDENNRVQMTPWKLREDGSYGRDLVTEVLDGKFTVRFEGVPEDQQHLIPPGF